MYGSVCLSAKLDVIRHPEASQNVYHCERCVYILLGGSFSYYTSITYVLMYAELFTAISQDVFLTFKQIV